MDVGAEEAGSSAHPLARSKAKMRKERAEILGNAPGPSNPGPLPGYAAVEHLAGSSGDVD